MNQKALIGAAGLIVMMLTTIAWSAVTIVKLERRVSDLEQSVRNTPEPSEMGGPLTLLEVRSEIREQLQQANTAAPVVSGPSGDTELRASVAQLNDRVDDVEKSAKRSEDRLDTAGVY